MADAEFIVAGTPPLVARAIEGHADHHRAVSALVVPWESHGDTLSLAVTLTTGEGWAIEHTNLGTIRLTGLGDDQTRVTLVAGEPSRAAVFHDFARQVLSRFWVGS